MRRAGRERERRLEQRLKANTPTWVTEAGRWMDSREAHPSKARAPIRRRVPVAGSLSAFSAEHPRKAASGIEKSLTLGRQKYGQSTRALETGTGSSTAPGSRQRCTAWSSAVRSSPCAASRQAVQAAAKFPRQCVSSISTTSMSSSGSSDANVPSLAFLGSIVVTTLRRIR